METPGVKKSQKKTKKSKRRSSNSSDGMNVDDDINTEELSPLASHESDILGNSLAGMSKDEMRKHYELCMRLAAENKITLKNSFGLHLIGIMRQMVSESTDLQLASLSLAASSKIYSGRVEALYKDTVQFHTSLQTMITTGKKSKKEEMETNEDEEDPSQKRKSKYNKYKSYLTNPETISIDTFGNSPLMPHPNFVVINSAFSANRSATKLVSLPLESDSNRLAFPCASCFRPQKEESASSGKDAPSEEVQVAEQIPKQVFTAPKLLRVQLEKVLQMKAQTFDEIETGHVSMYRPPPPSPPFEAPSNDDYSVFSAEPNADDNVGDMDGVIDRFSILNITVDAFTNAISKALTNDCSLDVSKLPEDSALRSVLKKPLVPKSTAKQKREVKIKEPFFNGERPVVQKTLFAEGKKSSTQATFSEWSIKDTSIFFDTDSYELKLPEDSKPTIAEICSFPFWYFSDKKEVDIPFFIKPMEPYKHPWNNFENDAQDKNRRSSFGRVIAGRSNLSDLVPEDLAQSFRDLNLSDSGGGGGDDPGSPAPLDETNLELHPPEWPSANLLEGGENSLPMPDVQSIMVPPPQVVKHINMRHEMVQNNLNMEKGKDIVWGLISSHLNKKECVLMSEIHQELGTVAKSLSSSTQSYSLGTCVQFTFVILLILANEKTLLLTNLDDTDDIRIEKDFREVEAVEGVLA